VVTCYPVSGKQKAVDICRAFAQGCGGQVVTDGKLRDGDAAFFGVDASNADIFRAVKRDFMARDWYYIDNSYFDVCRQAYFRVTRNRLQHGGVGGSDGKRFSAFGIPIEPWRESGEHVVYCPQSGSFMRDVEGVFYDWTRAALDESARYTQRPAVIRPWSSDKGRLSRTLAADLAGAHALVTWSSAAAITAVLAGVPVVCMGRCAASPMGCAMDQIEAPSLPDDRERWAGLLADNQWTLDEFKSGAAWARLNS
jgi:hypothetical protein